jgi:hypothetical protein
VQHCGYHAHGSFDFLVAGFDLAKVRERDHEANRAMPAHSEITDVIEKNGAADARFVFRLNEQRSDDDIGTARLIHNGGTESVELLLK